MPSRQRFRNHLKRLIDKQQGLCAICQMPMIRNDSKKAPNRYTATIDHIIPRCLGGKLSNNSRATHNWCNSSRNHGEPRLENIKAMQSTVTKVLKNKTINFICPNSIKDITAHL